MSTDIHAANAYWYSYTCSTKRMPGSLSVRNLPACFSESRINLVLNQVLCKSELQVFRFQSTSSPF